MSCYHEKLNFFKKYQELVEHFYAFDITMRHDMGNYPGLSSVKLSV